MLQNYKFRFTSPLSLDGAWQSLFNDDGSRNTQFICDAPTINNFTPNYFSINGEYDFNTSTAFSGGSYVGTADPKVVTISFTITHFNGVSENLNAEVMIGDCPTSQFEGD